MAKLISKATGNLTAAGTWGVADATSYLNSEAANTALTTSLVASQASTPGAITIDGVAVKIASRAASPTGTMDIELATGGVQVAGTGVQINVADLTLCTTTDLAGGWVFFKFAGPVTLLAATAYTVRAKTSAAAQVNLFRDATAANWSRALRTTTTAAPAAGDDMIVIGELTGAGTGNSFTVTQNSVAATDYGSNVTGANGLVAPALAIGKRGALVSGIAATTNYILRLSGNAIVYAGGTLNIGTAGAPIPRGSTSGIEFDCAADGDFGLTIRNLGTYTCRGLSRTLGKDFWSCKLNTDEAINSTSLGVDTDTGWLDNDLICVASTTQTGSQSEKGQLNGAAGASTLTVDSFAGVGGGLAAAHSGTAPTQAEVGLLTHNTFIRAVTAGLVTFASFRETASVDVEWCEFRYCGATGVTGVGIFTTTGSLSIKHFSIYDSDLNALAMSGAAWDNVTLQYGVLFSTISASGAMVTWPATTGVTWTVDNIWVFRTGGSFCFNLLDAGGTISNLLAVGSTNFGILISDTTGVIGAVSNLTAHSTGSSAANGGVSINIRNGTVSNLLCWRCGGPGFNTINVATVNNLTIDGFTAFGNFSSTFQSASTTTGSVSLTIKNLVSNGDTTFATTNGFDIGGAVDITVETGDMDTASGILNAHTNDVRLTGGADVKANIFLNNVKASAAVRVLTQGNLALGNQWGIRWSRFNQTANLEMFYGRNATIERDAAVFNTAAPSEKITPSVSVAGEVAESAPLRMLCDSGATKSLSVAVRKSATYAGAPPRLVLKRNAAMGVAADTVLDTMTVAVGSWETLTGTTPAALDDGVFEFLVDLDGTVGSVNVDDWL